jgi:nitronate monooxygenase
MWSRFGDRAALRGEFRARLVVPAVCAPMFLVSGPELVSAACGAGVAAGFPTLNARPAEALDDWLAQIAGDCPREAAPWAANLIVHKTNARLAEDLERVVRHRPPLVIASVGAPDPVIEAVHGYGGLVFADVASLRHARKASAAGADGLVLLTAGAGGHAGWLNPFAFLAEVRRFFDGIVAVAGCITQGRQIAALELLGADLAYVGSPFIATPESRAAEAHKASVVAAGIDDIVLTDAVTGLQGNFVRASLIEEGVMDANGKLLYDGDLDVHTWKTVWSAGQGAGAVGAVTPAAEIVGRLAAEYRAAKAG